MIRSIVGKTGWIKQ